MATAKIVYKQRHIDEESGRKYSASRNAHYALYIGYKPEEMKKSANERDDEKYLRTREHISRLVKYIGQREHAAKKNINKDVREVESNKLETYDTENDVELPSEAERRYKDEILDERDNGLFGYIGGMFSDEYNIKDVKRYVRRMSESHNVFHSIFSFTPESAEEAGLNTLEDWENWVKYHISDIANGMNMKIEDIEYVAAVHLKKGQPHVHIEWWNKEQQIYINKVDPLVCDAIRIAAIKGTYRNEFNSIHNREDEIIKELRGAVAEQTDKILAELTPDDYIQTIAKGLNHISDILPPKGQLRYKLLKPEVKVELDRLTHYIIDNNPQLADIYDRILEQRKLYNEMLHATGAEISNYSKLKLTKYFGGLNDDIERDVGNTLLRIMARERKAGRQRMIDALDAAPIPSEPDGLFHSERWMDYLEREVFDNIENDEPYIRWSKKFKEARAAAKNKEYDKALQLYSEEAKKGNALAEYEIADLYRRGLITGEDKSKEHYSAALKGFLETEREADTMKPYLQYRIGRMYYDGYGTKKNYAEALKWLEMSAKGGNHLAEITVAKMYASGTGTEKDSRKAALWYEKAEADNAYAAYKLGRMYYDGSGIKKDYKEAEKHLLRAIASKDDFDLAMILLGKIYSSDDKDTHDTDKAIAWYERAAEHNSADAAYQLYRLFIKQDGGKGRAHDWLNRAAEMYKQKAEKDNAYAALALGKIYADKECDIYDTALAEKWLRKAAESKSVCAAFAAYALGKLLMSDDVRQYADAANWMMESFDKGNYHAAFAAAKLLSDNEIGISIPGSARKWLEMARNGVVGELTDNLKFDEIKLNIARKSLDLHPKFEAPNGKDITKQVLESRLSEADYKLGKLYLSEELLDYELAETFLREASVLQNPYAMYALAKLYIKGDIPKNLSAAIQLIERAKELEKSIAPFADYTLGAMYLFDDDVRDRKLAEKYLKQSAQAGNEYAQKLLDNSAAWQKRNIYNLIGRVINILETNSRDGDMYLSEAASELFGRGDLSKEAIAELIYKMQDKQNTAEM